MSIAGHAVSVRPLFESTEFYCRNYLTAAPPEFTLALSREDLPTEQALLRREAEEEGLKPRTFPDPFLERSALQRKIGERLETFDIFLFHGSTVGVDGRAYLFTAPCGTGKSTHTRLWRQVFGDRAVMVNDDKPFLALTGEGVFAFGSPWSGKHGLDTNVKLPLAGICFLERSRENEIRRISPEMVREALLAQSSSAALALRLGERVPLWAMGCNKDPQAAEIAHAAMSRAENF